MRSLGAIYGSACWSCFSVPKSQCKQLISSFFPLLLYNFDCLFLSAYSLASVSFLIDFNLSPLSVLSLFTHNTFGVCHTHFPSILVQPLGAHLSHISHCVLTLSFLATAALLAIAIPVAQFRVRPGMSSHFKLLSPRLVSWKGLAKTKERWHQLFAE